MIIPMHGNISRRVTDKKNLEASNELFAKLEEKSIEEE